MNRVITRERSAALRYYHRTAQANFAKGLTCKGGKRLKARPFKSAWEREEWARVRSLRAWEKRATRFKLLGLTTRGTERVFKVRRGDAVLLREELDGLAAALGRCFQELPAAVKVRVLELERAMSLVRRPLV